MTEPTRSFSSINRKVGAEIRDICGTDGKVKVGRRLREKAVAADFALSVDLPEAVAT